MKTGVLILCLVSITASTSRRAAHAEEIRPTFEGLEPASDPVEALRLNSIGVVREAFSGAFGTVIIGRSVWWRPVRGKFRYAVTHEDFFHMMGRDDLGAQHRRRRILSTTLIWGGVITSIAGVAVTIWGFEDGRTSLGVGLGMVGGGFVLKAIGASIQPPLVTEEDALQMVNDYNRRLEVHLGLTPMGQANDRGRLTFGLRLGRGW